MSGRIKIGSGIKTLDQILLSIQVIVLVGFCVAPFFYPEVWVMPIIVLVAVAVQFSSKMSYSYLWIDGDEFIIERLFKKDLRIKTSSFRKVTPAGLGAVFTSAFIIQFQNGDCYKFIGDLKTMQQLRSKHGESERD